MNPIPFIWMALFLILTQTGCGTQIGISGQAREDYLKSIKPYIAYWEKEGVTEEGWRGDWVACGGHENGSFRFDSRKGVRGQSKNSE